MLLNAVPALQHTSYRLNKHQDNHFNPLENFDLSSQEEAMRNLGEIVVISACGNFQTVGTQVWNLHIAFLPGYFPAVILAGVPFAIIRALTHFKKGESTLVQQVFTLGWIGFGTVAGSIIPSLFRERAWFLYFGFAYRRRTAFFIAFFWYYTPRLQ
jgi:hypothetical protein